ncbi:MAK10-like protein, partial [Tanacetum coccineum]
SPTHILEAYVDVVSSDPHPRNLNGPPRQNYFTFQKRVRPDPQPQALETSFEARVRDYMTAHTERIERFKNAIFKQREEINDRMAGMFELLKELTTSRTSKKVLVREEARRLITKHVNSISLIKMEEENSVRNNEVVSKNIVEPIKLNVAITLEEVDRDDKAENRTNKEPVRSTKKDLTREKVKGLVETPKSQPVKFYLKHKINKELIEGLVGNPRFNDSLLAMQSGGLKYVDALVDQRSDVNVMPLSTYNRLTNENLVETDIRLSLSSQSHIYPLGIAEDVLVEATGFMYPVDFIILDIKEDRKRPFILRTPFLTTARAEIRFDKGIITLRSGKSKINFHKGPESLYKIKDEVENNTGHITPNSIMTLGWLLEEIHVTWAHLEKKQTRLGLYTRSLEEYAYNAWTRRHILL